MRLEDQAECLNNLLHYDSIFPKNSLILEAGCGTGAQTKIIAPMNPDSKFISIDISEDSIKKARQTIELNCINNVEFQVANIFDIKFPDEYFDHVFIFFVLEHIPNPTNALKAIKRVLKKEEQL